MCKHIADHLEPFLLPLTSYEPSHSTMGMAMLLDPRFKGDLLFARMAEACGKTRDSALRVMEQYKADLSAAALDLAVHIEQEQASKKNTAKQ